ncbi:hypothetical protein MKW98_003078 [Papaver atlanticum]|uniref:Glycine-rich protein n=1 Tax=Papaver atlanticum TaxID=357466 RepID=A0AAD4THM3_9MAGN|nr:hypothetical protein MKW98_003078 [Papaver atlanticum]
MKYFVVLLMVMMVMADSCMAIRKLEEEAADLSINGNEVEKMLEVEAVTSELYDHQKDKQEETTTTVMNTSEEVQETKKNKDVEGYQAGQHHGIPRQYYNDWGSSGNDVGGSG